MNLDTHTALPKLALIVAMTQDRVIGSGATLPWRLPEELQHFKRLTLNSTVIMGRKTFETIGRPLPQRNNIVLSRNRPTYSGVQVCNSFIDGLVAASRHNCPAFIIGGEELYRKALPLIEEIHISWINGDYRGDSYFPEIDFSQWRIIDSQDHSGFQYVYYQRNALNI
ncbi:MAG: dihydrofolate reductase [Desulfuromonadales bacterium]|nr:dihydrofolate reductase [Desulfuromonadales bacterium]